MKQLSVFLAAVLLPLAVSAADDAKNNLVRQTQEMFDAVSAGDAKVWDKYLAPGAVYVDEAGAVNSRAEIIKQIVPLPKGIAGTIKVNAVAFHQSGDTAILVHRDYETENYFGQTLHAEYLSTDTWQKSPGGWRLAAEQVLATLKEPPAILLPPTKLDEYVGTFELMDGSLSYAVTRQGTKLVGTRTAKPAAELLAEASDVFFVKGQPRIREIFQRDAAGHVIGFVDRREGRDVVWIRTK